MTQESEFRTVQTAIEARQLIDSEAYKNAHAGLKAQIIQQWKECPVRDREGQLLLLQLIKLADKFEGMLTGAIEAGKLAQHSIDLTNERNESKLQRAKRNVFG
ncbi:MAG: hypothetical protein EOO23_01685 [Comamonadaceae bacterium]|nr:MAG: hypothetical protein EOO23_01685 [Comamonadaceae bacterium]